MATKIYVDIDDRRFIVVLDEAGAPVRVKERKKYGKYPIDGWFDQTSWTARHHRMPKKGVILRAIEAAREAFNKSQTPRNSAAAASQ
jgi:hypothetical protein